jgi:hypothetical protein
MRAIGTGRNHVIETGAVAARAIALTLAGALSATGLTLLFFSGRGRLSLHTAVDMGGFLAISSTFAVTTIGLPALLILRVIRLELQWTRSIVLALVIGGAAGLMVLSGFDGPRPQSLSGWISILRSAGMVPFTAAGLCFGYGAWIRRGSGDVRLSGRV